MGTNIFKRLAVFLMTVVIFTAVIAPCLDLGEEDVYAASARTYTSMVRKSIPHSASQKKAYFTVF